MTRIVLIVQGQVQGVGFRPFVWRIANEEGLSGFCQNTSAGVRIEIQGWLHNVDNFSRRLEAEGPPLAKIASLAKTELPVHPGEAGFEIRASEGHAGQNVLVSPDVAICADCLADIRSPGNTRFAYPFTNCVNCGPRFSITAKIPYDRPMTTMACFQFCANCAAEYANPENRRFHAQPVACAKCGPKVWFVAAAEARAGRTLPNAQNCDHAIARTGAAILAGEIIAIRGLGGFQLACDARNAAAVARLRARKRRPHKALAIMAASLADCAKICEVDGLCAQLLTGRQKPIVVCKAKQELELCNWLSPDSLDLGLMLPYTPLHALLFDWLAANGMPVPLLVMTSANPSGEPICLGNREALARLSDYADGWLLHDRDILCRVDDSVVAVCNNAATYLRRARGYVPEPISLGATGASVLGAGAELKATFCLTRGENAFLSQHIGDLQSLRCMEFYEQAFAHLHNLLETQPELIVHDLHPDYMSSKFARAYASLHNIPSFALQHHAAHAASCLAENQIYAPALALCLDGSGLGENGEIWGGELLLVNLAKPDWRRLGRLAPFPLPGGEAAIRAPWRIAASLNWQLGLRAGIDVRIAAMLAGGVNCPLTSSCGRLFDAVSAQLGVCAEISYEGQAAIRLQKLATQWLDQRQQPTYEIPAITELDGLLQLNSAEIFERVLAQGRQSPGAAAAAFHYGLASGFATMAAKAAQTHSCRIIALTGGALQNSLLAALLRRFLFEVGLEPIWHKALPPGDGALSLGQAAWGRQILAKKHN